MAAQYYEGIGRRKASTARVRLMEGSGEFTINGKPVEEYFTRFGDLQAIMFAFDAVDENRSRYDVSVLVNGGGVTGQTDAVKLGLARAFIQMNPGHQPLLKKVSYLTRDSREKERKKPGLKRARKAPTDQSDRPDRSKGVARFAGPGPSARCAGLRPGPHGDHRRDARDRPVRNVQPDAHGTLLQPAMGREQVPGCPGGRVRQDGRPGVLGKARAQPRRHRQDPRQRCDGQAGRVDGVGRGGAIAGLAGTRTAPLLWREHRHFFTRIPATYALSEGRAPARTLTPGIRKLQ